jgi:hypothetical protein
LKDSLLLRLKVALQQDGMPKAKDAVVAAGA